MFLHNRVNILAVWGGRGGEFEKKCAKAVLESPDYSNEEWSHSSVTLGTGGVDVTSCLLAKN